MDRDRIDETKPRWWQVFRRHKLRALEAVQDTAAFRRTVDRERSLVDRAGRCFSLLAFEAKSGSGEDDQLALVTVATKRRRLVDDLGWLSDGRFGMLLRDTTGEGAEVLAGHILTLLQERGLGVGRLPSHQVFTYPDGGEVEELSERAGRVSATARNHPAWKRGMDVVGSVVGIVLLSPVMLATAVLVRATSGSPILYKQTRTGEGMRPFTMYKFRSMRVGADAEREALQDLNEMDGPLFKAKDDPRLTRVGKILRKASLDEIPQLFNVLKGDMSLVGPRALSPSPDEYEPWQLRRFNVRPGLACLWQVESREKRSFTEWMRSDLRYVQRPITPVGDIALLCGIIRRVVSLRGGV